LFCILSSTGIFLIFKFLDRFRVPSFPVIVINYLFATLLGVLLTPTRHGFQRAMGSDWLVPGLVIGFLFIVMFFLVAHSSARAGISVTTVAGKMSVIFPIVFFFFFYPGDTITLAKGAAIITALAGVSLTVIHPERMKTDRTVVLIPLLLFVGMGLVDSLVKYAQHRFVDNEETALFSASLFFMAFITGVLVIPFRRQSAGAFGSLKAWIWGGALGAVNFGSIYFLVRTLNYGNPPGTAFDSSVVFGVNNTAIVALSVLAGYVVFSERLLPVNWIGIGLSVLALILFSWTL